MYNAPKAPMTIVCIGNAWDSSDADMAMWAEGGAETNNLLQQQQGDPFPGIGGPIFRGESLRYVHER
jgi:arabinogalactan endo-1,4-beta-galactosidase